MYRCLLIDHDDTSVDSTRHIHYPAHLEILKTLRPNHTPISIDGWFEKNFSPGLFDYYTGELGFTEDEMAREFEIWRGFTTTMVPDFFPGLVPVLTEFRRRGGVVVVVSHSEVEHIRRDYLHRAGGFLPDLIFGWDHDPQRRKPHPWPAEEALRQLGLKPHEAAMLDDLLPGVEMAERAGIDALGAGWGHRVDTISQEMRRRCRAYFETVDELGSFLLGDR